MLTDVFIRNAKPKERPYRVADGRGLYLLVKPNGKKLFRWDYRFHGTRKTMAFGAYPEVSLKDARQKHEDGRRLLDNDIDPMEYKKQKKVTAAEDHNLFEPIAREWWLKKKVGWAENHAKKVLGRLENHIFPWLGKTPIVEITAPMLLKCLQRLEDRGTIESAHRVKNICGQIFRYAIATSRAERDPSADLRGALTPYKKKHLAAITAPAQVGGLLKAIDEYSGNLIVRCALKLAPLTFVRPGELRHAEWTEINFSKALWEIPGEKMKMGQPHIVPLSRQAMAVLEEISPLTGHDGKYVFPTVRSQTRPMSENTINAALCSMGYSGGEMVGHGFRAMARTLLDEELGVRPDWIEHQLAHAVRDPNGRAYNRTTFLKERHEMMQRWADYLDALKAGTTTAPLPLH